MKITKEELLKENAILKKELETVDSRSKFTREMFSRIVAGTKTDQWGNEKMIDLSWIEIAHRIGIKDGKSIAFEREDLMKNFDIFLDELQQRVSLLEASKKE